MDVNGTRFHLIADADDWSGVTDISPPEGGAYYDRSQGVLGLKPRLPIFPRGRRSALLNPADRRGAASDRFGTWYWISRDKRTIMRAPAGSTRAVVYWSQSLPAPAVSSGAFAPHTPPLMPADLAGLAVTAHHYLVVGTVNPAGLLLFDLHAGGEPVEVQFPVDVPFEPFDMTTTADANTWIVDRTNRRLWGLDRYFRLLPLVAPTPGVPQPGDFAVATSTEPPSAPPTAPVPQPLALAALDPIAVDAMPDGGLLILDAPSAIGGNSRIFYFRPGATPGTLLAPIAPITLPGLIDVAADQGNRPVVAYDLAVAPDTALVYIVEQAGNQAVAYRFDPAAVDTITPPLTPQAIYLPMHYFGSRALARGWKPSGEAAVFYDVTPLPANDLAVRWIRLHEIEQPRFTRQAWVQTPVFDSHQAKTIWHRLFLDACIPPETEVQVWTRASDNRELLDHQAFTREPDLYLRSRGAEIPYWQGWEVDEDIDPEAAHTGTWELLFQQAVGQYMQIRLVLTGNGRTSPQIQRLRAYYPRFSYLKNYLPAAYQEEPASAHFLERFLANLEGFYTDLEGKIANSSLLVDPRSAPVDALDWLATWLGVALDPLWTKIGEEDRRRLLIRFTRRLYERRGTPDGLRFALLLLLDPCLESTLKRLEQATVVFDLALRDELASLGLAYPAHNSGEIELEELLWSYVLTTPGRSQVRIVERWQTRQGMALQAGDVTLDPQPEMSLPEALEAAKHRFSVLVPENLPSEHAAMVDKIIRLQKPVHTDYALRHFWDLFLVGQVRLGIDTVLGEEGRFLPIILGRDYLAEGYLEAAHPMDVAERAISDRDRMGDMKL